MLFCFVVEEDAVGRGVVIIKLPVFYAPQVCNQEDDCYQKADRKKENGYDHVCDF
jgi:hypothetical protein